MTVSKIMVRDNENFIECIRDITGFAFQQHHEALLDEALTHPSKKNKKNYERLEFLGDRVLALIIAEWMFEEYPNEQEGFLSVISARLVSKQTLSAIGEKLELSQWLSWGGGSKNASDRAISSAVVNGLEALIAVLFIAGGFEVVRGFIKNHWQEYIILPDSQINNPRGYLQELLQSKKLKEPVYELLSATGLSHAPIFKIKLTCELGEVICEAESKKMAMTRAAEELLNKLSAKKKSVKHKQ